MASQEQGVTLCANEDIIFFQEKNNLELTVAGFLIEIETSFRLHWQGRRILAGGRRRKAGTLKVLTSFIQSFLVLSVTFSKGRFESNIQEYDVEC